MTITDIASAYTDEQRAAIARTLMGCKDNDWVSYPRSSSLHTKGRQAFAAFGGAIAYEVFTKRIDHDGNSIEVCPAATADGNFVMEAPEEGRTGVMHLMRFLSRNGQAVKNSEWTTSFVPCRWLHVAELEMKPAEILERIAAEIDAGGTPLTGFNDYPAYS